MVIWGSPCSSPVGTAKGEALGERSLAGGWDLDWPRLAGTKSHHLFGNLQAMCG